MGKTLVTYFSASGVTKRVAEKLAKAAGAELFEIVPKQPFQPDLQMPGGAAGALRTRASIYRKTSVMTSSMRTA